MMTEYATPKIDVDATIRRALASRDVSLRELLIEQEVDCYGNYVGTGQAERVWHQIIPDTEVRATISA